MIKIIWDDAGGFSTEETWLNKDDVLEAYGLANFIQVSVGFLVFENKVDVVIAQSIDNDDGATNYAQCLRIPKCLIRETVELEERNDEQP